MAFNPTIKYKIFGEENNDNAVIIIHGGTFTDGDETWNNEQAKYLSDKWKMDIYTINFSKKNLEESVNDICNFYKDIYNYYNGPPGLIGISSGGFLVLQCLEQINKHMPKPLFIYLLGPVLCPKGREKFVSETIISKQKKYFNNNVPEKTSSTKDKFYVILSDTDENIPYDLTMKTIKEYPNSIVKVLNNKSHKEICMNTEELSKLSKLYMFENIPEDLEFDEEKAIINRVDDKIIKETEEYCIYERTIRIFQKKPLQQTSVFLNKMGKKNKISTNSLKSLDEIPKSNKRPRKE